VAAVQERTLDRNRTITATLLAASVALATKLIVSGMRGSAGGTMGGVEPTPP